MKLVMRTAFAMAVVAALSVPASAQVLPPIEQLRTGAPTLAAHPEITTFNFVVAGDNRPARRGDPLTQPFLDIITRMKALAPALAVWNGDNIYGKGAANLSGQYDQALRAFGAAPVPIFNAPGNHELVVQTNIPCGNGKDPWSAELPDYSGAMLAGYQASMGAPFGSFRYGNAAFLLLNTDDVPDVPIPAACDYNGFVGLAQLNALKTSLDAASTDASVAHIFVFMHRPVYDDNGSHLVPEKGRHVSKSAYAKRLSDVRTLLDSTAYPKLQFVFASHDHRLYVHPKNARMDRTAPQAARPTFIVTAGAGAPLTGCGQGPTPSAGAYFHFLKVSVDGPKVSVVVEPLYGTTPCTQPPK